MRPIDRLETTQTIDDEDDGMYVDFNAAGLYLAAAQVIGTSVLIASLSAVSAWLGGENASAIRNLAVCAGAAAACLYRPLRVGRVPGLAAVFAALRPCPVIYLGSLVAGQLTHSCLALQTEPETPYWRAVVFHVLQAPLLLSGFWRAFHPVSNKDRTVLVVSATLLILAVIPLPGTKGDGPLCAGPTLAAAAVRLLRALLFSVLYTVHVFSSAPVDFERGEVLLSATRSAAASVWVLGAYPLTLPAVALQLAVLVYTRVGISRGGQTALRELEAAEDPPKQPAAYAAVNNHSDGEHSDCGESGLATCGAPSLFGSLPVSHLRRIARESVSVVSSDEQLSAALSEASTHDSLQVNLGMQLPRAPALLPRGESTPWRELSRPATASAGMTQERMAAIAASLTS